MNRNLVFIPDETMGRLRSAQNFVRTLEGTEEPLNDPSQAVKLMRIIDALFASAAQGKPIQLS